MKYVMAMYRIKPEKLDASLQIIADLVETVKQNEPRTISYQAFKEPAGSLFVHVVGFVDAEAEETHLNSARVKDLVRKLYANCETQPMFTTLELLHSK
jgi:quinol monooxygenase YgiN